jgi:N-methylhydantoinase A
MIRAIRAVSTYRGRDPRDFALLTFGGSGPIHAADMARSLGIKTVVVPPAPGLFSAIGLLQARPEHHFVRTYFTRVADADLSAIRRVFEEFERRSTVSLQADRYDIADVQWLRSFDLRYVGQAHELTISTQAGSLDEKILQDMVSSFHDEHDRTYGHKAEGEPTEIVNLRLTARSELRGSVPTRPASTRDAVDSHDRSVYFGRDTGSLSTSVVDRSSVPSSPTAGPLIIEEYDATTVVSPDCSVHLDNLNNIVIDVALD